MNVMQQVDRSENFSTNYLNNSPRTAPLYIFSQFGNNWLSEPDDDGSDAYFNPDLYQNNHFIYLSGKKSQDGIHHFDLWANGIILHELGHSYHEDSPYSHWDPCYQSSVWNVQSWDSTGPYRETVANVFGNMIKNEDILGDEDFDHTYSTNYPNLLDCDKLRINYIYVGDEKIAVYDFNHKDLEEPTNWADFSLADPNANLYMGAVTATLWDIYDIDDNNHEYTEGEIEGIPGLFIFNNDHLSTNDFNTFWCTTTRSNDIMSFYYNYINDFELTGINLDYFDLLVESHNIVGARYIVEDETWNDPTRYVTTNIIVSENVTLTINPITEVIFIGSAKIILYGDLICDGVTFNSINSNLQGGIEIYNNDSVSFNNIDFNDNFLYSEHSEISIFASDFNDAKISLNSHDLHLEDTNFLNTPVEVDIIGPMSLYETITIDNCDFSSNDTYALNISLYPNFNIENSSFSSLSRNCVILYECGSGKFHDFLGNEIQNSINGRGLFIYHSNVNIQGSNQITNNLTGIYGIQNSKIYLVGNELQPYQSIHNNSNTELLFSHDSFPTRLTFNQVYDDEGLLLECINHTGGTHNVAYNYWGDNFNPLVSFNPNDAFIYEPIWEIGISKENQSAEELYLEASSNFEQDNYSISKQQFMDVIELYPESNFATGSIKKLLQVEQFDTADFNALKQYYISNSNILNYQNLNQIAEDHSNYCDIKCNEFEIAISYLEDIIDSPPSELDSLCAMIDIGLTYILMDYSGYRQDFTGRYPHLKPNSKEEFSEFRNSLFDQIYSLNSNQNNDDDNFQSNHIISSCYPNPFNPQTTIYLNLKKEKCINVSVYNIKGQKINDLFDGILTKGDNYITWDGRDSNNNKVSSGVYFYQISSEKTNVVGKMLLIK